MGLGLAEGMGRCREGVGRWVFVQGRSTAMGGGMLIGVPRRQAPHEERERRQRATSESRVANNGRKLGCREGGGQSWTTVGGGGRQGKVEVGRDHVKGTVLA